MVIKNFVLNSLVLRILILLCLIIYTVGEFLDGIIDIGDVLLPFLILLQAIDIISIRNSLRDGTYQKTMRKNKDGWAASLKNFYSREFGMKLRFFTNATVFMVIMFSFVGDSLVVYPYIFNQIIKAIIALWSFIYLIFCLIDLRKIFTIRRLVVTNLAFGIFLGMALIY